MLTELMLSEVPIQALLLLIVKASEPEDIDRCDINKRIALMLERRGGCCTSQNHQTEEVSTRNKIMRTLPAQDATSGQLKQSASCSSTALTKSNFVTKMPPPEIS